MGNDLIWMLGSDFHIPYENPKYVSLWWQVMDYLRPDVVDILGDLDDARACSRFADGQPEEVLDDTVAYAEMVKEFFAKTREYCPDSQIHFATGNHEIRWDDYVAKKAPALRGMITPEILWGVDTHGIELSYYNNPPVHRFGDLYAHHGIYALKNSGESVRKVLDEFGVSCIVGHSHRQGYAPRSFPLRGEMLRGYELGHMTDIYSVGMGYDRKHDWQPGFAVGFIENGNYPHIQLISISPDNTCVVDGKLFVA